MSVEDLPGLRAPWPVAAPAPKSPTLSLKWTLAGNRTGSRLG